MLFNFDFNSSDLDGPSGDDLASIDAEWPLIQEDIDMLANPAAVDALVDEIYALEKNATGRAWRHRRRAEARITRVATSVTGRSARRKAA